MLEAMNIPLISYRSDVRFEWIDQLLELDNTIFDPSYAFDMQRSMEPTAFQYEQAHLIVKLVEKMKWECVQVIYDSTQSKLSDLVMDTLKKKEIALVQTHFLDFRANRYHYSFDEREHELRMKKKFKTVREAIKSESHARVVLLLAEKSSILQIMKDVATRHPSRYIWVICTAWFGIFDGLFFQSRFHKFDGSYVITTQNEIEWKDYFNKYFKGLHPTDLTHVDPFFRLAYYEVTRCAAWSQFCPDAICSYEFNHRHVCRYDHHDDYTQQIIFSNMFRVFTSLDKQMKGRNNKDFDDAFRRSFNLTDKLRFDRLCKNHDEYNGLPLELYILQIKNDKFVKIGSAPLCKSDRLKVKWEKEAELYRINSTCNETCKKVDEFRFYTDEKHHFECTRCKNYEIPDAAGYKCIECKELYWPNENRTSCDKLELATLSTNKLLASFQGILATLGIITTAWVIKFFYDHQEFKIIKATSLPLSYMILAGILFGYADMFVYLCSPSFAVCFIRYTVADISYLAIYSPIMIRALRIYRIFKAKHRLKSKTSDQVLYCVGMISLPVIVILVVYALDANVDVKNFTAVNVMPTRNINRAESLCNINLLIRFINLSYTVIIISYCLYLAFKTRRLPSNFNESRHICHCSATSIFLIINFVPMYFQSRGIIKLYIRVIELFLNHSLCLGFLFVPKILPVMYEKQDREKQIETLQGLKGRWLCIRQQKGRINKALLSVVDLDTFNLTSSLNSQSLNSSQGKKRSINASIDRKSTLSSTQEGMSFKDDMFSNENSESFRSKITEETPKPPWLLSGNENEIGISSSWTGIPSDVVSEKPPTIKFADKVEDEFQRNINTDKSSSNVDLKLKSPNRSDLNLSELTVEKRVPDNVKSEPIAGTSKSENLVATKSQTFLSEELTDQSRKTSSILELIQTNQR